MVCDGKMCLNSEKDDGMQSTRWLVQKHNTWCFLFLSMNFHPWKNLSSLSKLSGISPTWKVPNAKSHEQISRRICSNYLDLSYSSRFNIFDFNFTLKKDITCKQGVETTSSMKLLGQQQQPVGCQLRDTRRNNDPKPNLQDPVYSDDNCLILQPAFGCCACQTLVKIWFFQVFHMKNVKKGKRRQKWDLFGLYPNVGQMSYFQKKLFSNPVAAGIKSWPNFCSEASRTKGNYVWVWLEHKILRTLR